MTIVAKRIASAAIPSQKASSLQMKDTLELLYRLHSSLEVNTVIDQFATAVKHVILYDSIQYQYLNQTIDICIGKNGQHALYYDLKTEAISLGTIKFTRNTPFNKQERLALEDSLGLLLIPLKNALSYHHLLHTALHDPLTGAANLTAFQIALKRELSLAKRHNTTFSILAFDLDYFKAINDKYGHGYGDAILKYFTEQVSSSVRESDSLFRTGGEEFMVLLTATDTAGAIKLAERMRKRIEQSRYVADKTVIRYTTSIGVASYIPEENIHTLLARADQALYRAKHQGRNRVCI